MRGEGVVHKFGVSSLSEKKSDIFVLSEVLGSRPPLFRFFSLFSVFFFLVGLLSAVFFVKGA